MGALDSRARLAALERSGIRLIGVQEALQEACQAAAGLLRGDAAQVNVVTRYEQEFLAEWPRPRRWRKPVPLSNSGCREVVIAEHTLVIDDTHEHPVVCVMPWVQDWRGYIGAPIAYDTQVIGSLCVLTKEPRDWTDGDVAALEVLADKVSASL